MSVVIRMKRAGAKKRPFFRVVVADSRSPRDGRYIEQLGWYDPLTNPATFKIDATRLSKWIQRGARPSESVGVMVAKHAPDALRPATPIVPEAPVPAPETEKPKKARGKKAGVAKKASPKAKAATKGGEKKAKTRAKAKARKASGVPAKPKAAKKAKK
jgi:small subunit ribosomal protein S16